MKKKSLTVLVSALALFLAVSITAEAQEKYQLNKEETKLIIKGTSNLHDWEMKAEDIRGFASSILQSASIESFKDAKISVDVESIESGKRIMNNKTYDALKADDHPKITFQLKSVKDLYAAGSNFSGKAVGQLTIAGKTNQVTIPFSGKMLKNGSMITISGDYSLRMTNFNVEPPTAMLGSLTTGDEVTIEYNFAFSKN
jgi:polyisoprenoid-binding protein YceI